MGIPSYFSHIVKQHRTIIRPYLKGVEKISNLYLDCNSIIYDAVHNKDSVTEKLDEKKLIMAVCDLLPLTELRQSLN
jgi:5'-3' exonuclease